MDKSAVIAGGALLVPPIRAFAGLRRTPNISGGQAGIRAAGDEQQSNGGLTAVIRALKRRNAGSVSRVNIRAAVQKSLGDLRVPSPGRHVERGALFGVASFIHPRSCSNQCADNVAAARHGHSLATQYSGGCPPTLGSAPRRSSSSTIRRFFCADAS